ncbi:hypothetical protein Acsp04_09050 [Actinomadura sp. NBRC 104425]|uniref:hypothetical protein n=1 Tax=Actinomadura sp. NBRC 104425 TaxID=3032204 RepID=UPI00249FFD90|nr:hypothetical protein [Actinomadura sp. NBRC 104425]GLZ10670.1 hypothetical protein Acsp04_09050 [Actinomadura sp. NBRC 104425]
MEVDRTEAIRDYAVSVWRHGDREVAIRVPHEPLTAEAVRSVARKTTLIIVREITPGAREALKQPTRARYVQPEHILWMLASLVKSRGDELTADELILSLQLIRVSSLDADGWYLLHPDEVSAPPPFHGALPSLTSPSEAAAPSDDELD